MIRMNRSLIIKEPKGRKTMRKIGIVFCFVFLVLLFVPQNAEAIPAWAKKYGTDCSMCHRVGQSTLNSEGQNFLRRGHRISNDEVIMELDKLFSLNTKLRIRDSNASGYNSTFELHAFSVYTGGMLSNNFSYFTEMYLYENTGKTSGPADSAYHSKLADAYLMYTSHPKSDTFTSFRVGQISPSQMQLFWGVGPRYTETRNYLVNNSAVSPNTYKPFMRNFGAEIAQTVHNFHGALGILNGTGASFTNSVDNNESKDFYATVDYSLDSEGSAVGVYGYKGKGLITPSSGSPWENEFSRVGLFGRCVKGPLSVTAAATKGREQLDSKNTKADNLGLLLEMDYELNDKIALFGRYDYFDPNRSKQSDQLSGPMLGLNYRMFDQGRMTVEYHKQGKSVSTGSKPWEYRVEMAFIF